MQQASTKSARPRQERWRTSRAEAGQLGGVASGQSRRLKAVNGAPTPQPPLPEVLAELDRKVAGTLLAHEWRTDGVRPATIGFG